MNTIVFVLWIIRDSPRKDALNICRSLVRRQSSFVMQQEENLQRPLLRDIPFESKAAIIVFVRVMRNIVNAVGVKDINIYAKDWM